MEQDRNFKPSVAEVKEFQAKYDMGVQEAVRCLTKANYMQACKDATTVQELAELLFRIIEDKF